MKILQPPHAHGITGGFLFNRRLADASKGAITVETVEGPALASALQRASREPRFLDSLYLRDPRTVSALEALAPRSWRGVGWLLHSAPTARTLERAAFRVVPGEWMARHLRGAGVRKEITVLVPGVDRAFVRVRERRIARPTTEAPRLLTVANAHPGKGLIEGLRALAALPTPWRWAIAGSWETEPDYARAFEAEARALGVHDRIERLGTVAPDVILRELSSADVFLLPSRFENQSLAVLEAVAAGVPILTTRTGENATWVLDHLTGRLVDAGAGMEDELRAAVGEILADPVTLGRYERNSARAPVPVGTWEQAAQAWIDRFSPGDRRARRADGSSAST